MLHVTTAVEYLSNATVIVVTKCSNTRRLYIGGVTTLQRYKLHLTLQLFFEFCLLINT